MYSQMISSDRGDLSCAFVGGALFIFDNQQALKREKSWGQQTNRNVVIIPNAKLRHPLNGAICYGALVFYLPNIVNNPDTNVLCVLGCQIQNMDNSRNITSIDQHSWGLSPSQLPANAASSFLFDVDIFSFNHKIGQDALCKVIFMIGTPQNNTSRILTGTNISIQIKDPPSNVTYFHYESLLGDRSIHTNTGGQYYLKLMEYVDNVTRQN